MGGHNPSFRGAVCEQRTHGSVGAGAGNRPGYPIVGRTIAFVLGLSSLRREGGHRGTYRADWHQFRVGTAASTAERVVSPTAPPSAGSAPGASNPRGVTMSTHDCSALPEFRVSFPGPFTHHDVVVDGWRAVPFLQAHMAAEDRVMLVLDRRLAAEMTVEEADRLIPFVADAIAVALGYGAHPNEDTPRPLARAPYSAD